MKRDISCVSPNDSAAAAARKMRDYNVGFLPVCDDRKNVVGAVTDRDIAIRLVAEGRPTHTQVKELMTHEVICCKPDDDMRQAEQLMGEHHKSRIMCVDGNGVLVGVISLSDIAEHDDGGRAAETMRQVSEREARA